LVLARVHRTADARYHGRHGERKSKRINAILDEFMRTVRCRIYTDAWSGQRRYGWAFSGASFDVANSLVGVY
jgi:hypothetical protein